MDGSASEVAFSHKLPHSSRHRTKLEIVTNRNLPGLLFSDSYNSLSVARIQSEGLLNVNVASCLQTLNAEREVTERGVVM